MIKDNRIDPQIVGKTGVSSVVEDALTGTVAENKAVFDKLPAEIIRLFNVLIDYMDKSGYDNFPQSQSFKLMKLNERNQIVVSNDGIYWQEVNKGEQGEPGAIENLSEQTVIFDKDTGTRDLVSGDKLSTLFGKQLRINEGNKITETTIHKFEALGFKR